MERQILHVDVNNAFLSWSAVDMLRKGETIDIRNIAAIIGGDEAKRSGIVLAKSMFAKRMGVTTGEAIYQAKKKCPNLKIYPTNFTVYREFSDKLYAILLDYTDIIERFSIDECFMDMTFFLKKRDIMEIAKEIKQRVFEELSFTVNIGVANNKLLAKMASDFEKPNKIHTLFKNEIPEKMWKLPIEDLFMLGKKTSPKLYLIGIRTIGDLAKSDLNIIINKFGKHGKMMWEFANGIDDSEVNCEYEAPKGIGNSTTLPKDVRSLDELNIILLGLTEQVAYRLRKCRLLTTNVSVQLRTQNFKDFSHQKKLFNATSNTIEIYEQAKAIMKEMYKNESIRLVGLRVDNLIGKNQEQLCLFENESRQKQEKIDEIMDNIKGKYGYSSVSRGGTIITGKKTL